MSQSLPLNATKFMFCYECNRSRFVDGSPAQSHGTRVSLLSTPPKTASAASHMESVRRKTQCGAWPTLRNTNGRMFHVVMWT